VQNPPPAVSSKNIYTWGIFIYFEQLPLHVHLYNGQNVNYRLPPNPIRQVRDCQLHQKNGPWYNLWPIIKSKGELINDNVSNFIKCCFPPFWESTIHFANLTELRWKRMENMRFTYSSDKCGPMCWESIFCIGADNRTNWIDDTLAKMEETVSHEIILIFEPVFSKRNPDIKQNSTARGWCSTDAGISSIRSFKKNAIANPSPSTRDH
jgi:hypothetical protein